MTPCRIEDVLASEGVYAATTWGTSMYPMLRSGRDTVILRPPQGRLRCYDVPVYAVTNFLYPCAAPQHGLYS